MIGNSSIHKIVSLLLCAALFLCAPWFTAFAEEPPDDALGLSGQEGAALSLGTSMTVSELQALIDANQGGTVTATGNVVAEGYDEELSTIAPVTVQLGDYGIDATDGGLTICGPIHFVGAGEERPLYDGSGLDIADQDFGDVCTFTATGDNAVAVRLYVFSFSGQFATITALGKDSVALCLTEDDSSSISELIVRAENEGGIGVLSEGRYLSMLYCDILAGAESVAFANELWAAGCILTPEPVGNVELEPASIVIGAAWGTRVVESTKQVFQTGGGSLPKRFTVEIAYESYPVWTTVPIAWDDREVDYHTVGEYQATATINLPGRLQCEPREWKVDVSVYDPADLYFGGFTDWIPGEYAFLHFFSGSHLSGQTTLWYSSDDGETWQEWQEIGDNGFEEELDSLFNDPVNHPDRRCIEIMLESMSEGIPHLFYLELETEGQQSVCSNVGIITKSEHGATWKPDEGGDRDGSGRNPGTDLPDPEPPDGGDNPDPDPDQEPPPGGGENPDPVPPDGGEKPGPGPGTGPPDSGTPPEPELPGGSGGNGAGNNGKATPSGSSGSRTDDTRTAAADAVSPAVQMDLPITGESPPTHPIYAEPDQSNTVPHSTVEGEAPAHSFSRQDLDRLLQANPVNVDFFAGGLRLTLPHAALASVELGEDELFVVDLTMPEDNRFSLRLWAGEREIVSFPDTRFAVTLPYPPADDSMEIVCTGADGDRPPATYHGGRLTVTLVKTGEYTITQEGIQPLAAQADPPISGQAPPEPETPAATSSFPWSALLAVPALVVLGGAIIRRKLGRPLWKRG